MSLPEDPKPLTREQVAETIMGYVDWIADRFQHDGTFDMQAMDVRTGSGQEVTILVVRRDAWRVVEEIFLGDDRFVLRNGGGAMTQ